MNAPLTKEQLALLSSNSLTDRATRVEHAGSHPREVAPGFYGRLRAAAARLMAWPRRRAVLDELSMLTDRELADIGLNRAELGRVFDPRFTQARRKGA